ncbi:LysR substrate-binding domain-containing protein, partial [Enterococcus faecium]|uniref:LysR substrate-binding domain-containing protein n=1 Tax=Enterococcus faecium TaxID=1352 RepID=UPI003F42B151
HADLRRPLSRGRGRHQCEQPPIDVIASGFDAGIRYGGTVPEDMIAQRLSPDIRWVAAASPVYLERFGTPTTPHDLHKHRCVCIRLGNDQIYQW